MTVKLDFSRALRGAAWALARVSCVGLLFLGTTNCLPAPSDDSGGSSGGGNSSAGGNGGNVTPQGGTTHAPTGGSTYVSQGGTSYVPPQGGTPQGGTTNVSQGGTSYVPPQGGTPEGGTTTTPPVGGTTSLPPVGGTTSLPPVGGTTSLPPVGGTTSPPAGGAIAITCTPVPKSSGGLACPGKKCTLGTYSGYNFTFVDPTGKSTICMTPESLCGAGTTGAQDPPAYSVWGAGFGFNLSPLTTETTAVPVQLSGSGVTVTVSSLPTGADLRVQVNVGGTAYCAKMTTATQTLPWTSFNSTCWTPTPAGALAGAPNTPNIQFQASSGTAAGTFDFCVTALSFQ